MGRQGGTGCRGPARSLGCFGFPSVYCIHSLNAGRQCGPPPSQGLLFILSALESLKSPSRSQLAAHMVPCTRHSRKVASRCPEQGECLGTLTLREGISQPVAKLISFPLSGRREEDSFLFRGPLKAESDDNSCSQAELCSLEQVSVLILSTSFRLPGVGFSLLTSRCLYYDFSTPPIFLMEGLTLLLSVFLMPLPCLL